MIYVDLYEPEEIDRLLVQSVPVTRSGLNQRGFADYMWQAVDGHMVQVERKQWGEVVGDIDHVEEQLSREIQVVDETHLVIEGILAPTPYGADVYRRAESKPIYHVSHSYGYKGKQQPWLYSRLMAWLWQIDKAGISVHWTLDLAATAIALVAWYKQGQKVEHQTLKRYIRPRINVGTRDPLVMTLIGIPGVALGEVRAKAIAAEYGTLFGVVCADVDELARVEGLGIAQARKLLKTMGRDDIG